MIKVQEEREGRNAKSKYCCRGHQRPGWSEHVIGGLVAGDVELQLCHWEAQEKSVLQGKDRARKAGWGQLMGQARTEHITDMTACHFLNNTVRE